LPSLLIEPFIDGGVFGLRVVLNRARQTNLQPDPEGVTSLNVFQGQGRNPAIGRDDTVRSFSRQAMIR
jgi:hypothetical protein